MKRFASAVAAIALAAGAGWAQDESTPEDRTFIHAGRLLAVPGEAVLEEQTIIISGDRIESIQAGFIIPEFGTVIDLSDHFVLPGLIDSHVHLSGELGPTGRLDTVTLSGTDVAFNAARHSRTTLLSGFTTAQDVGGGLETMTAVRDAIADGDIIGPRLRVSGPAVTPTGGHGDINGYTEEVMDLLTNRYACNGPADCRRAVRELIRGGADVIKITATGGVLSNTAAGVEQQFFVDELEAIVGAAHMMGRRVTAHAHGVTGINSFLEAGGNSVEHGSYLDRDSVRLFRRNGAYLVPTVLAGVTVSEIAESPQSAAVLTPAQRDKALQVGPQMLDMVRAAHEGGVPIAFGTDSGVSRHGLNAREFQLYVDAGMSEMEAIVTATVNAADHVQMAEDIGTIEAGKFADIIAVDGDPLEDIGELMDVDFVMKGGEVYSEE